MIDRIDALSSVSGGSWASVLYTFLPDTIDGRPVGEDDFLTTPIDPAQLRLGSESDDDPANVAFLNPNSLGTVPQRFDPAVIAELLWKLYRWGMFRNRLKSRWFWIIAVGDIVLAPFDLYESKYRRRKNFNEPSRFFSESNHYIKDHLQSKNPTLKLGDFHTARPGRPPLIVNMNIIQNDDVARSAQIPVQVTPIEAGALGQSPDGKLRGGGSVDSFAFTSTLLPSPSSDISAGSDSASVEVDRRYSLSDIAGCSSAFYAAVILQYLDAELDKIEDEITNVLGRKLHFHWLARKLRWLVHKKLEPLLNADAEALIPAYNYWSPSEASKAGEPDPANATHGFSDGGDFENTGILGALARTDVTRVLSFVNGAAPLSCDLATDEILLDGQVATLFGYKGTPICGIWTSYGGMSPEEPRSYAQVFSDAKGEFAAVRKGLYDASRGETAAAGSATATFRQTLTTVDNPVAHIAGGRTIEVLWVYNNRVDTWQNQITDPTIQADLQRGQEQREGPLANFPSYTTAGQIHLSKEGVNMLAQLSAWNVQQIAPEIADLVAP